MSQTGIGRKLAAFVAAACLAAACFGLTACGGSTASSSATASGSESASASSASASANSTNIFAGKWLIAAAESQGVTMAGNFSAMLGVSDKGTMTLNEDGTGEMSLGDEAVTLKWVEAGADAITLTPEATAGNTVESIDVTYRNDALLMPIEQDGQVGTLIFTQSGTYAGAKEIDLSKAKPITTEADLLGSWNMTGMVMMGITIYGDTDALSAMGGSDGTVTFKEGGVLDYSGLSGTWEITADGATATFSDSFAAQGPFPVVALEDGEIAVDMASAMQVDAAGDMQGREFAVVYMKSKS